jgi:multidrug resistance protein, MATE family
MKSEAYNTIKLAVPIIIGELAQMALHIIDSAMVGAISYKLLAATSLVVSALNIPFIMGIGITISVSQMVSMAHGRKDGASVSHYLFNGFWLCAVTAVVISLSLVFGRNILYYLGQDPDVVELSLPFMKLLGISIIPMLLFMTLKQFTDGLQFTRTAMVLSLCAMPVNIFLNWLLIYGNWGFPRLELTGAGWATLITRVLIFVVLAIIILRHKTFSEYISHRHTQWKFNGQTLRSLLRIGIPSSLQVGMEAGAFAITGIVPGRYGSRCIRDYRYSDRNNGGRVAGSTPDRAQLCRPDIHGVDGIIARWFNKNQQRLRCNELAADCTDRKKHIVNRHYLRNNVCNYVHRIPQCDSASIQ